MVVELEEGCFDDAVRERRMVQVIPKAGCATAPEQVMAGCLSDEQVAANARDVVFSWEVATIESPADKSAGPVNKNAGE